MVSLLKTSSATETLEFRPRLDSVSGMYAIAHFPILSLICNSFRGRAVRVGQFGRSQPPARRITHGAEEDIAWKVTFRGRMLVGGKPNGECRLSQRRPK